MMHCDCCDRMFDEKTQDHAMYLPDTTICEDCVDGLETQAREWFEQENQDAQWIEQWK